MAKTQGRDMRPKRVGSNPQFKTPKQFNVPPKPSPPPDKTKKDRK